MPLLMASPIGLLSAKTEKFLEPISFPVIAVLGSRHVAILAG